MTYAHLRVTLLRTVPERTAAHELRQHVVCLYMRVCVGYVWCMRLRTGPGRTRVQTIPTHLMAEKKLHRQARKGSGRRASRREPPCLGSGKRGLADVPPGGSFRAQMPATVKAKVSPRRIIRA